MSDTILTVDTSSPGVSVKIQCVRFDGDRHQFRWTLIGPDGIIATAEDLWSDSQVADAPRTWSLVEAFGSWCSFFGAYIEARGYPDSENANLFPPECGELADALDSGDPGVWYAELTGVWDR